MNAVYYMTLPHLYKLLSNKMIAFAVVVVSFLFIFNMNLVGIVLFTISVMAIPFSFYMLFVLYTYNKIGWVIGFIIWMSLSFLPFFLMTPENLFSVAAKFAPLLFFVLYTMLLKMKVGEWLIESGYELEAIK